MKTDSPIKLGMNDALAQEHFSRKGDKWVRDDQETILVVHLQKSNFSNQYYVNLGVYVKGLGGPDLAAPSLQEPQCHVRIRADMLGETKADWKSILDMDDKALAKMDRQMRTAAMVRRVVIPWLTLCSTRAGLRVAQEEERLKGAVVDKRVRDAIA